MAGSVLKIGCILTTFPCRTETFIAREIEGLRSMGLDITVFAAAQHECHLRYADNVKVLYRPSRFSAAGFRSIWYLLARYPLALGKLLCLTFKLLLACPREAVLLIGNLHTIGFFSRHLRNERISHIHAYFLSWPATIGLALSVVTGLTFSISAHARDVFVEQGAIGLKTSRAKFIAVCTRQGLNHLKAVLGPEHHDKLHLNYHGTKIKTEASEIGGKDVRPSQDGDLVIAAGRLLAKKGFANLITAFARVVREKPGCRLTIAGEGNERERLEELILQLALEDNVRLIGWSEPDAMLRLVRQATVMVVPSIVADDGDRDGIPNVLLEAFAVGTPVVASGLEGISEAIEHRHNGLLVEPGNVEELASTISEVLEDKEMQNQLSQVAQITAVERFDSAKNVKQLAELFAGAN